MATVGGVRGGPGPSRDAGCLGRDRAEDGPQAEDRPRADDGPRRRPGAG